MNTSLSIDTLKIVGVLGGGQMGAGITQVLATVGFTVHFADMDLEHASKAKAKIESRLARSVSKNRISEAEKGEILDRIHPVDGLKSLTQVDFVIEAVTEKEDLKLSLFRQLDEVCPPHAILASNTSSIPITRIAAVTRRPHQVVGMHFMNPVPVMTLVELIRGIATDDPTYACTQALAEKMGKTTVLARDMPGFIVNRILMPMINEAITVLYEGIGSREDIDAGMKLGTKQPMGPLALADFIGLDTCLAIMEVLHVGTGDSKYRPCPLLRQYVDAGWYGQKSGRGFYEY
jgi:3-hydroxybutyryl-CoA dehydrogenase